MDLTSLLIAAAILVLPSVLTWLLSGGSGDAQKVLGAYTPSRRPGAVPRRGAGLRERVHALVAQRRDAEAVKLVQQAARLPLEKAKNVVATVQRAGTVRPGKRPDTSIEPLSREMVEEARRLVAQGEKIEAVKLLQKRTGMGLKEAIALADRLG